MTRSQRITMWTLRIVLGTFLVFWLFGPLWGYLRGWETWWRSDDEGLVTALLWPLLWIGGYQMAKWRRDIEERAVARQRQAELAEHRAEGWEVCPACNGSGEINVIRGGRITSVKRVKDHPDRGQGSARDITVTERVADG